MMNKLLNINMKFKIIIIFLVLLALILIFTNTSTEERIIKILKNNNYIAENGSSLYQKRLSDISLEEYNTNVENNISNTYEENCFDIKEYQLIKNKLEYNDKIQINFTPQYNYKTEELTYTYRISTDDASAILEGEYNYKTGNFTCDSSYKNNFSLEDTKETLCKKIESDAKSFYIEAKNLISSSLRKKIVKK